MYKSKSCQAKKYTKADFVKGEKRYKYKKCGCQFVPTRQKGMCGQEKLVAIWLRMFFQDNCQVFKSQCSFCLKLLLKKQVLIGEAYCRTTKLLIDWKCGTRSSEAFTQICSRLKRQNVKVYFSDKYSIYRNLISPELLIQTKSETLLIESNNLPQRH